MIIILIHGPTQQCYVFSESVSQAEDIISNQCSIIIENCFLLNALLTFFIIKNAGK